MLEPLREVHCHRAPLREHRIMRNSVAMRFLGVAACGVLVFFVLADILFVPLPRRGMQGGGLYTFVDELRFYELFFSTLGASWFVARWLRLSRTGCCLLAVGAALGSMSLLIADVRRHGYSDWIERQIAESYGSPTVVWIYAGGLACLGIGCWLWAWHREPSQGPQPYRERRCPVQ